jgi:uncharacterized OsmC-like protein
MGIRRKRMSRERGNQESEWQEVQEPPSSIVKRRQEPLRAWYQTATHDARILDRARTLDSCATDPFHGAVVIGAEQGTPYRFGIHRAVGGYHDLPNPGDLLCAALASCLDATVRMIADRLGIRLTHLMVSVEASADARGTLLVDRRVPVGFQKMDCTVRLQAADAEASKIERLIRAAEQSCIVLQTLRGGIAPELYIAANE